LLKFHTNTFASNKFGTSAMNCSILPYVQFSRSVFPTKSKKDEKTSFSMCHVHLIKYRNNNQAVWDIV
jgi:hypothetical protein